MMICNCSWTIMKEKRVHALIMYLQQCVAPPNITRGLRRKTTLPQSGSIDRCSISMMKILEQCTTCPSPRSFLSVKRLSWCRANIPWILFHCVLSRYATISAAPRSSMHGGTTSHKTYYKQCASYQDCADSWKSFVQKIRRKRNIRDISASLLMEAKNNSTYHCNNEKRRVILFFFLPLQRTGICASLYLYLYLIFFTNKPRIASGRTSSVFYERAPILLWNKPAILFKWIW